MAAVSGNGANGSSTGAAKPTPNVVQPPMSEFVRDLCTTNGGQVDTEALRRLTGHSA